MTTYIVDRSTDYLYDSIVNTLQVKGPLFVKVGQYLSTKRDYLPEKLIEKLQVLQENNIFTLPDLEFVRENHYQLLRCMGSGSIGSVFKAFSLENIDRLIDSSENQLNVIASNVIASNVIASNVIASNDLEGDKM